MKKVILFLCQGLEEYEASVFTDTIGWTTTYGLEPIELVTVVILTLHLRTAFVS